jgi:hypothetical protein
MNSKSSEGVDKVNELSAEIYKLEQKSASLKKISDQFERIDKKIIKTNDDLEEMNSLLESAGETLDTTREKDDDGNEIEGTSEQDKYNKLKTDEERYKYLKQVQAQADREADLLRDTQVRIMTEMRKNNIEQYKAVMDENTSNADYLATQSAMRAAAYNNLYDVVDKLEESGGINTDVLKDTEKLTSSILGSMTAMEAMEFAEHENRMESLVNSIKDLKIATENGKISASDLFLDEGATILERVEAYRVLESALKRDTIAFKAFKEAYAD